MNKAWLPTQLFSHVPIKKSNGVNSVERGGQEDGHPFRFICEEVLDQETFQNAEQSGKELQLVETLNHLSSLIVQAAE